jgi:molybdopterin-guanine dinucleotide biosynthesis protein A
VLFGAHLSQYRSLEAMNKANSKGKQAPGFNGLTIQRFNPLSTEICILAGGLSERMGRDKSRLRLGPTTMLGHIQKSARATGLPIRIIRRDCVPKCGPLGGIYTALKTTKADAILFLACDMPLVSTELIQSIVRRTGAQTSQLSMESRLQPAPFFAIHHDPTGNAKTSSVSAIFTRFRRRTGFPFLLPREAVEIACQQMKNGDFSLQSLSKALRATVLSLKRPWSKQLFNVNTPKDWTTMRRTVLGGNL